MINVEIKGAEFISKGNLGKFIQEEFDAAILEMANETKADFEKTVETWDEKPEFVVEQTTKGAKVYTTDKVYRFLNNGTSVRRVSLPNGYIPKSQPGVIGSFAGNRNRRKIVISKQFEFDGIKPRKWSEIIQAKRRGLLGKFGRNIVERIRKGFSNLWR